MKEIVLQHFFEGHATSTELAQDLLGTRDLHEPLGFRSLANYRVVRMSHTFAVKPDHIVRLINAVTEGTLSRELLGDLCFCLEAAPERFLWDTDNSDGERIADAVFWLGTPEINYPLTTSVLDKIRHYLATGENTLSREDLGGHP